MRLILRGILRALLIVLVVVLTIPVMGLSYGWIATDPIEMAPFEASPDRPDETVRVAIRESIPGYQREVESTYLTYPEWAIVYAAREYAGFVASRPPSGFPYWAYIARFWKDYAIVIRATEAYPFNFQNHLMLVVIGTSHTVEHAIQSVYENTVGRLTEFTIPETGTPQDRDLAAIAAEYAAFLDQVPWYEFPYVERREVFMDTHEQSGWPRVRAWERKVGYGLAMTIKQFYADVIRSGLSATSDAALLEIHVLAAGEAEVAVEGLDDTRIVLEPAEGLYVFVTPRYQIFTDRVPEMIAGGLRFVEIGGNDEILLTVTSAGPVATPDGAQMLFSYAVPAAPAISRTGLRAQVSRLHEIVPALLEAGTTLEHLYDY